jgi:hypothetical protein
METGTLVSYIDLFLHCDFVMQVAKLTTDGYVKHYIDPDDIFVVIGQLSNNEASKAAYSLLTQADTEFHPPNLSVKRFICLSRDGIIVLPENNIQVQQNVASM